VKKYVLWCVIVVVLLVAAPVVLRGLRPAVRALTPVAPPQSEPRRIVTREHFDNIQTGMTYEQVVEIIGFDGIFNGEERITDDFGKAVLLKSYDWKNGAFGGFMNTIFADGRLINKSEYELPQTSSQ